MWAILLIIAGIILEANPEWFAGAATVGAFCLWVGIIIVIIVMIIWLLMAIGLVAGSTSSRSRRKRW